MAAGACTASQRSRVAERLGGTPFERCHQDNVDGEVEIGLPPAVDRHWSGAALCPQPHADALPLQQQRRGRAANIIGPDSVREQRPMSDAHRWQVEHGTELQREPCAARMVPGSRIDEQHLRLHGKRPDRCLEASALA